MARRAKKFTDAKRVQIAADIKITKQQHINLLKYIEDRMVFGSSIRPAFLEQLKTLDLQVVSEPILRDIDDRKRDNDNKQGVAPKPVDTRLPLIHAQLDEAATYMLSIISHDTDLYGAIAKPNKQPFATAVADKFNEESQKFAHTDAYSRLIYEALKYNFGGFILDWVKKFGKKITVSEDFNTTIEKGLLFEGNNFTVIDLYNFIWDPSVEPSELAEKGEFFGSVKVVTPFFLRRLAANGELFNVDELVQTNASPKTKYYEVRPKINRPSADSEGGSSGGDTDWVAIVSGSEQTQQDFSQIELNTFYCHIIPNEFGLSDSTELEIWKFITGNGHHVVFAAELDNAHGMLPAFITTPIKDGFGLQTHGFGKMLVPLQNFSSFQINVHQKAARKALYGITLYDVNKVDLGDEYDAIAGKIPMKLTGDDKDINRVFKQILDAPKTENTMRDIAAVSEIMQAILPTDLIRQVTSLDRATKFQAAATVQATNRRSLKLAKTMDNQCFAKARGGMFYNEMQFRDTFEVFDEQGQSSDIQSGQMIAAGVEMAVSAGLSGLDKLSLVDALREIINMVLQSQVANQQVDIVKLLDYFLSILGDKSDFSQFKLQAAIDQLTPEEKDVAFQLFQQAAQAQESGAGGQTQGAL